MFCANCGSAVNPGAGFCPACGARMGAGAPPPPPVQSAGPSAPAPAFAAAPPAYPPVAVSYASWGTRAIGYIIDSLLVGAAMAVIYLIAGTLLAGVARLAGENAAGGMCCVVLLTFPLATLLVGLVNRVYLVALRGYSIGQGVVKVKVVDANGQLLTQVTAFVRLLAQVAMGLVPLLPILDLLWPLWDERRQTLHDKAVGCYVIENPAA